MVGIQDIKEKPYNLDAEKGILSNIFLDPSLIREAISKGISENSFHAKEHKWIFGAMAGLHSGGKAIDGITVTNRLKEKKTLDLAGGDAYLVDLQMFSLSASSNDEYINIVKDKQQRRQLIELAEKVSVGAYGIKNIEQIMSDIQGLSLRINPETGGPFTHLSYADKIDRGLSELANTDPNKIIKWGWEEWDSMLGGIYGGKVYVVGAETGTGKSTFINQVCKNATRQGWKVVKYSLEDRMEDAAKEELWVECNRLRAVDGKPAYGWVDFVNNEYSYGDMEVMKDFNEYIGKAVDILKDFEIVELDKDRQITIDEMVVKMEEAAKNGAKMFAIDHLHYFKLSGGTRGDLEITDAMHKINEIARKYQVAVFLVAHYVKESSTAKGVPHVNDFAGGAAIKQVANYVIQLLRDDDITEFFFTKGRGPIKLETKQGRFNLETFEYDFKKSEEQVTAERNYYLNKL